MDSGLTCPGRYRKAPSPEDPRAASSWWPLLTLTLVTGLALGREELPADARPGGGYLFAHMTSADYGRLHYAVSRDGLRWNRLNAGKRVLNDYRGHPDIARGHDKRYYLIGNHERRPEINLWVSEDLVVWKTAGSFRPDLSEVPGFPRAISYIGAPKIFFDEPSRRYVITWHTPDVEGDPTDTEKFWRHMRTLYVTSPDLVLFSSPRRLFDWDLATIDVILRQEGGQYYAFIKDERYPEYDWPTGKTIRVATADDVLGPYGELSHPITPNFREAPTVIPRPGGIGWYLYSEQYPGVSYSLATSRSLAGPWHDVYWEDYHAPPESRHGCMIQISGEQYQKLVDAFGVEEDKPAPRLLPEIKSDP